MTQNIVDEIKESLGDKIIEIKTPADRRVFLTISADNLLKVIEILGNDFGFRHLSTITGIDTVKNFEILYHFAISQVSLTIRVIISRKIQKFLQYADLFQEQFFMKERFRIFSE